jgi:hypothetical protein
VPHHHGINTTPDARISGDHGVLPCYEPQHRSPSSSVGPRAGAVPIVEYRASTVNFSDPTKELDAAMRAGRLQHDGNLVLEWCLGNVVGRYDAVEHYPRKSRPEQKVDAAITTILGIGRCLDAQPFCSW